MRKIPSEITDQAVLTQLQKLNQEIDGKMKVVNQIRDKLKKTGPNSAELETLKKVGAEIDLLDREWKTLTQGNE